jgi:hypothetical protein
MHKNIPLVVISCNRDIDMLALQAHSFYTYYESWLTDEQRSADIYIIVNESGSNINLWQEQYSTRIAEWLKPFNVKILYKDDFMGDWASWVENKINPWAVGWEVQQLLKLAVAVYIDAPGYLILDSQNFLINSWSTKFYSVIDDKLPYRPASFNMPIDMWNSYCQALDIDISPNNKTLNICTPLFFHTDLVKSLLNSKENLFEFSNWFKSISKSKSEFTLYYLWAEKHGGIEKYHYEAPSWGGYYLRDHPNFDQEFNHYLSNLKTVARHAWTSINHRAWGDMTDEQYRRLQAELTKMHLYDGYFNDYRANYVNIKI